MKSFKIHKARLLILSLLFSVIFISCDKDNNTDQPAPQLPPESSLIMDFSGFSNPDDTTSAREVATYQNWGHSYLNVVVWQTLIHVGMVVPVSAFYESFKHEAIYNPNENNWTWSYNFAVNGNIHEAELTGFIVNDTVNWEMRITKDGHYSDFLWYYGKNSFDRSGGYWIMNENPTNPSKLLKINWTYEGEGIGDIKYTNIKPGGAENGGYISYGTLSGDMTRFYTIFNKGKDNLTNIEWNNEDLHGRVMDPLKFGNDQWHCWDTSLQDIDCP